MKNLRIIITVVIVSVIAIFIGSAIRSYYLFLKEPLLPVLSALPDKSAVVISTKSTFQLFETINNSAFVDLLGTTNSSYSYINNYLDSINLKSSKLKKILESSEVIIALYPQGEYNSILIALAIGKTSARSIENEVNLLVSADSSSIINSAHDIYKVSSRKGNLWFYTQQGILAVSNDSTLINASLDGLLSKENLACDSSLLKLTSARGKRVDANLLINTGIFSDAIWPDHSSLLKKGTPFDKWISFDLNIKKNSVQLGGFSISQAEHLFKKQVPVENHTYNFYPRNTSLAITLSLSDVPLYTSQMLARDTLHVDGYDPSIKQQTKEIFTPIDHVNSWIGNSVSIIFTNDYFRNHSGSRLVMIECRDKDSASWYLKPFIEPINDSVGRLHYTSMTSDLFGQAFSLKGPLYCLVSRNFVTISSDRNLLYAGISRNNQHIKDFEVTKENIGTKSTISVLVRPEIIAKWLKNKNPNKQLLSFLARQSSIGFQYSAGDKLEYAHAWIYPNIKSKSLFAENELKRPQKIELKTIDQNPKPIASTDKEIEKEETENFLEILPKEQILESKEINVKSSIQVSSIVNGPTKNQKCIAIITEKGEFHLIDSEGSKLFRFNGKETLLPCINEVDANKDGKSEYIVASRNFLYHIDSRGDLVESHPIKLQNPIERYFSVFDYDSKKDYRILYVGTDDKIYNITLKGTELPDWQKPSVVGSGKITFCRTNGRDYIIYQYENQIKIFDRRGKERIKVSNSVKLSKNSTIAENKTNSKGIFLGTSQNGELVYINEQGMISKSSFGNFTNDPWFNYYDFDADGSMDFIFADKNRVSVYNRLKEPIIDRKGNFSTPYIYSSSSKDKWLFVRNNKTKEIIAIHNKGKSINTGSLFSDTNPIVFNPGGSKEEILVTTKKGKVVLTPLEKL